MEFPNKFKIIVKTNSKKNEIVYDEVKKFYRVNIKEKAEDNKANKEIIKFLSKLTKKKARIISGLRSREKLIEIK